MKACVFVDGENFRHSIVELFSTFRREDYLPKQADWTALFDGIVTYAASGAERIRTYWYVINSLSFYPYKSPNPKASNDPAKAMKDLKDLLCHHPPYKEELDTLLPESCSPRMDEIVKSLLERREQMRRRLEGWTALQNGIAERHTAIEFRRAGVMTCNLFESSLGIEKAVDVKLACDLITLERIYDVAVIVSGDQDYVPAAQVVKDYGKRVVNVAFKTRSGRLLPGGARALNQITDWSSEIDYQTLTDYLKIGQMPLA